MEIQLAALSGKGELYHLILQLFTEAYYGRLRNARMFSTRGKELAKRTTLKELAAHFEGLEALSEAEFGNRDLARQAATDTLSLSTGRLELQNASLALARSGDSTRAQALVAELNKRFPSDTLLQRYWLPTIRASIEIARKNPSEALVPLQDAPYELGMTLGGWAP